MRLQDAIAVSEEYLEESEVSVGILGHERDSYEPLLQPREKLIETVKRYKIQSGLPRIFKRVETSANKEKSSSAASFDKGMDSTAPLSKTEGENTAEEDSQKIIMRTKEFYRELHHRRRIQSVKIWKKLKSLPSEFKHKKAK